MSDLKQWAKWLAQVVSQAAEKHRCRPLATYRVQFAPGIMGFRDAARIVPYLDELGVSHLYASPYLKARRGCPHGYAIVDYSQLNPELGSRSDYSSMVEALHKREMGQILDVVPNHMSAAPCENAWWDDVLENGPASPHAAYFDIDWRPIKEELRNKILLPVLGEQYGQVLEAGELQIEYRDGAFFLRYSQLCLPLDPRTYRTILAHGLDKIRSEESPDSEQLRELESIVTALEHLPERTDTDPESVAERQREKEVIKGRLRTLTDNSPVMEKYIASAVKEFNGTPDDTSSYDDLDALLGDQVYRLSHWKAAADEINYRRFFDINELAAVCTEAPAVFAESHNLVFELLVRGDVNGLRIDHIDGLYDPVEYLRRLQRGYLTALARELYKDATKPARRAAAGVPPGTAPAWEELEGKLLPQVNSLFCSSRAEFPLYVVAEKILCCEENLPGNWLLYGTTGYDFLNALGGLFVDASGLAELTKIYDRFIEQRLDFHEISRQSKLVIFRTVMSSDLQLLAMRLNRISERHRRSRDFTFNTLRTALREILAYFSVYRTYINEGCVSERDRQIVCHAAARAKRSNPAADAAVFDFIRDVLLLETPPNLDAAGCLERNLFVGRVQQVTSSVMAKGIEDTAFYRYFPLASLNEVGGDPLRGVRTVDDFHRRNLARQADWPESLICTSTHDTKRSEDARARISVLSEIPHLWQKALNRWARINRPHRREVDGEPAPSRNDEFLFYQSLVGIWPLVPPQKKELRELAERMANYMEKATREAKVHTSWINPDSEYDKAVREYVTTVLDDNRKNRFPGEFLQFHRQIVGWGLYSALSQTFLKLASPGVPDIYQGRELWDFSLVDPDNRRPVDFSDYRKILNRLRKSAGRGDLSLLSLARRLSHDPFDARIKLFVTWRMLQFRHRYSGLFLHGDYIPLDVEGAKAKHLCAFAWQWSPSAAETGENGAVAIVVAPRLIAGLTPAASDAEKPLPPQGREIWEDTHVLLDKMVPVPPLKNLFTGQVCEAKESRIAAADALSGFPVAFLYNADFAG